MKVTLKMIAEKAGVSVMAASAALHKTSHSRVSDETRGKVRAIAEQLGYRPNVLAQALSNGKSRLLGVVVDSCLLPVVVAILRGVECKATAHGYRVMIAEQNASPQNIMEQCDTFDQYGVEGILCLSHDYPQLRADIRKVFRRRTNILFWESPQGINAPYVALDASQTYREVLCAWKKAGRKKPVMLIDDLGNRHVNVRRQVFLKAARECGLVPQVVKLHSGPYLREIFPLMQDILREQLIPQNVDAVFAESDLWGAALLNAAREEGLAVPEDLAVVGWDNSVFCGGMAPALASVDIRAEELGGMLVEMFLELQSKGVCKPRALPVRFVNRASSGI